MGWDYSISRVCRIRFCIGVILIVARTPMKILAPPSFVLDRSTDWPEMVILTITPLYPYGIHFAYLEL